MDGGSGACDLHAYVLLRRPAQCLPNLPTTARYIDSPLVLNAQDMSLARWLRITDGTAWPTFARGLDGAVDLDRVRLVRLSITAKPNVFSLGQASTGQNRTGRRRRNRSGLPALGANNTIADAARCVAANAPGQLQTHNGGKLCDGAALRLLLWLAAWGDDDQLSALAAERICCADDAATDDMAVSLAINALAVAVSCADRRDKDRDGSINSGTIRSKAEPSPGRTGAIRLRPFVRTVHELAQHANALAEPGRDAMLPTCSVCLVDAPALVLEPCGHACLCQDDWQSLLDRQKSRNSVRCPLCRVNIEAAWALRPLWNGRMRPTEAVPDTIPVCSVASCDAEPNSGQARARTTRNVPISRAENLNATPTIVLDGRPSDVEVHHAQQAEPRSPGGTPNSAAAPGVQDAGIAQLAPRRLLPRIRPSALEQSREIALPRSTLHSTQTLHRTDFQTALASERLAGGDDSDTFVFTTQDNNDGNQRSYRPRQRHGSKGLVSFPLGNRGPAGQAEDPGLQRAFL
jgi:hypothetical protein